MAHVSGSFRGCDPCEEHRGCDTSTDINTYVSMSFIIVSGTDHLLQVLSKVFLLRITGVQTEAVSYGMQCAGILGCINKIDLTCMSFLVSKHCLNVTVCQDKICAIRLCLEQTLSRVIIQTIEKTPEQIDTFSFSNDY